jgi:tetratricopeptide (TPR) repeat protein
VRGERRVRLIEEADMAKIRIAGFMLGIALIASGAWAQDWRGEGRLAGKVVDEQGKPLDGVRVRAAFAATVGAIEAKTDKRGDWTIEGVAEGTWQLTFEKDGYHPAEATSEVEEGGRSAAVRTTLKKVFDPNAFIKEEAKKADALMSQKKFAEARVVYEGIVAKVPEITGPMQQNLARTYYLEGKLDKAVEHMKAGLAMDPANVQAKMLLASVLVESGALDEASQLLSTIDDSSITDPQIYLSFGLALITKQRSADALPYLDKAVARFPQSPQAYYYRANALIDLVNAEKDPKNPQRIERLGKIKADLQKFLQIAPNAPEAEHVKKLLEQIEK